jgi:hypothetical protein
MATNEDMERRIKVTMLGNGLLLIAGGLSAVAIRPGCGIIPGERSG